MLLIQRFHCEPVPSQNTLALPAAAGGMDAYWQERVAKIERIQQTLYGVTAVAYAILLVARTTRSWALCRAVLPICWAALAVNVVYQLYINRLHVKHEVNLNNWLISEVKSHINRNEIDEACNLFRILNANFYNNAIRMSEIRNKTTLMINGNSDLFDPKPVRDLCFELAEACAGNGRFEALDLIPSERNEKERKSHAPQRTKLLQVIKEECEKRLSPTKRSDIRGPEVQKEELSRIKAVAEDLMKNWSEQFSKFRRDIDNPYLGGENYPKCPRSEKIVTLWAYDAHKLPKARPSAD